MPRTACLEGPGRSGPCGVPSRTWNDLDSQDKRTDLLSDLDYRCPEVPGAPRPLHLPAEKVFWHGRPMQMMPTFAGRCQAPSA
eukprot:13564183-Alexandrium_andersonii.AAC.1